jgi:hypothetical protein
VSETTYAELYTSPTDALSASRGALEAAEPIDVTSTEA